MGCLSSYELTAPNRAPELPVSGLHLSANGDCARTANALPALVRAVVRLGIALRVLEFPAELWVVDDQVGVRANLDVALSGVHAEDARRLRAAGVHHVVERDAARRDA